MKSKVEFSAHSDILDFLKFADFRYSFFGVPEEDYQRDHAIDLFLIKLMGMDVHFYQDFNPPQHLIK